MEIKLLNSYPNRRIVYNDSSTSKAAKLSIPKKLVSALAKNTDEVTYYDFGDFAVIANSLVNIEDSIIISEKQDSDVLLNKISELENELHKVKSRVTNLENKAGD